LLEAYLDESGTHTDSPIVTVGGLMATTEDWRRLSDSWRAQLDRYQVSYFHAAEFEARRGPFQRLGSDDRLELQTGLIDLIRNTPSLGHTFSLHRGSPESWEGPNERFLREPYQAVLPSCVAEFAIRSPSFRVGSSEQDQRVDYICDTQKQWGPAAVEVVRGMRTAEELAEFRDRIGDFRFGNSRKLPPLQAADLLVYEVLKDRLNRGVRLERRSFTRLQSGKMQLMQHWGNRQDFETLGATVYFKEYLLPRANAGLAVLREPGSTRREGDRPAPIPKVGRNDPCPCGSEKKYKKCHGHATDA
jgi:hypothetical protein